MIRKSDHINKKALGSLGSLVIVTLIVITPVLLAGGLEKIETSGSRLIPTDIILSSSETLVSYTPYLDFNYDTKGPLLYDGWWGNYGMILVPSSGSGAEDFTTLQYDYNGFWDLGISTNDHTSQVTLYLELNCSAEDLIQDDANQLVFGIKTDLDFSFHGIWWKSRYANYEVYGRTPFNDIPSNWYGIQTGGGTRYYNMTISQTDLNNGASYQGTYPVHQIQIGFSLPDGYSANEPIEVLFQINPDYFEESSNCNHQITTIYEPYKLGISNQYTIHKWSLGIGGGILILTALIISPFFNPTEFIRIKNRKRR